MIEFEMEACCIGVCHALVDTGSGRSDMCICEESLVLTEDVLDTGLVSYACNIETYLISSPVKGRANKLVYIMSTLLNTRTTSVIHHIDYLPPLIGAQYTPSTHPEGQCSQYELYPSQSLLSLKSFCLLH